MNLNFREFLNDREKAAWISFKGAVENFLGNFKRDKYKKIVKNMLQKFEHFLENLGDYSEEQGKRFHQEIKEMERHYQGRWNEHMMADFCSLLKRDVAVEYRKRKRNPLRRTFEDKKTRKRRTN